MSNTKLRRRAMLGGGDPNDVVDFGLSVKWLKYNLAGDKLTNNESDYGYYYQWAGTIGYTDGDTLPNPPYYVSYNKYSKYVTSSSYGTVDNKTILDPEDDAVTTLLGSEYRIPTVDEVQELYQHCGGALSGSLSGTTSVSSKGIYFVASGTTVDGVKYKNPGCLFVGQDIAKRIFLPAGCRFEYSGDSVMGEYWTNSVTYSIYGKMFGFNIKSNSFTTNGSNWRYVGYSVRGVKIT